MPQGGWGLPDPSGGCNQVLLADRLGHVDGRHVPRRQLLGVEPGTDAVIALAQVIDVRDAVHPQQLVPHVNGGEIAQVNIVVATVRREKVDDHQDVGGLLADRDPLVLDRGRQLRHGQRHTVLHHHQVRVQVGADVEGDRQRVGAVVAHLGGHVEHALDTVDLLLDRRGHRIGHHRSAGAGIADRHGHARRRDPGVLGNGQREAGDPANQGDDDGQHRSEDRSIDEEPCDHGKGPAQRLGWS